MTAPHDHRAPRSLRAPAAATDEPGESAPPGKSMADVLGLTTPAPEIPLRRIRGTRPHGSGSGSRSGSGSGSRSGSGSGSGSGSSSGQVRVRRRRKVDKAAKRRDIQGLRAVAVVAVVVNHLVDQPRGGFVGVDVFFVISGFLITGHLVREGGRNGISLVDFYRRRIRRLFPSALTVTVLTVLTAWLLFTAERFHATVVDALWATGFAANWRFLAEGTDYFQSYGPVSPLRHYWSLSVEEQYYLVWPLVLIAVFALVKRRAAGREQAATIAAAAAALALTVGSLVVAAVVTSADPVSAYFSTFTRGWELGLGSALAVVAPRIRLKVVAATVLSWLGLAVIAVSMVAVTANTAFPFPGALVPCLGSALVLVAGSTRGVVPRVKVLTNRVSVYLGDLSYSIYVVHFPVIVFAAAVTARRGWAYSTAVLLLVLGLSVLLFHLIENPVRLSNWLAPRRERGSSGGLRLDRLARPALWGSAAVVTAAATFVLAMPVSSSVQRNAEIAAALDSNDAPTATMPGAAPLGPQATKLAGQVKDALALQSWPTFTPSFDDPEKVDNHQCPRAGLLPASECTWGPADAPHTLYMIGDSTSGAYFVAMTDMIASVPGWKVRVASGAGCGFGATVLNDAEGNAKAANCGPRNADVLADVLASKPDVLVLTNHIGDTEWTESERAQLTKMQGAFGKLVVMPAPPNTDAPADCKTQVSAPADCVTSVPSDYASWMVNGQQLASEFGGVLINPISWTCNSGFCPVFVGTTPMKKDSVHITDTFSRLLAPVVLEAFTAEKVFEPATD